MKKFRLSQIPKYLPYKDLKKSVKKQLENFKLIFKPGNKNAFLLTEENKNLENISWKNKIISVEEIDFEIKEREKNNIIYNNIKEVVTPLYHLPYDEQINFKKLNLQREFKNENITIYPVENKFRNKFEFTFGFKEGEPILGFRTGAFTKNMNSVDFENDISFIPDFLVKKITEINKNLKSDFIFDREKKTGYLKFLMIRLNKKNQCIALLALQSNKCTELKKFIEELPFENLYVKYDDDIFEGIRGTEIEKIRGVNFFYEEVLNYQFKISFFSFFQTNIECFEKIILFISQEIFDEHILDLCCGTATIGILLSSRVKSVIGIELNEECKKLAYQAMEDNKITNYSYYISDLLKFNYEDIPDRQYVAILDPPRSGVHKKVIQKIRELKIKKLIFISCDFKQVKKNIEDLMREESNTYKGDPFKISTITGFDMFPNTKNVETVIILER